MNADPKNLSDNSEFSRRTAPKIKKEILERALPNTKKSLPTKALMAIKKTNKRILFMYNLSNG
jgi:predicted nucleotidyltransferase